MKICAIGIGYVGLSAALSLASVGHYIYCIDKNEEKIQNLKQGILPIYEPKMQNFLQNYNQNLIFDTKIPQNCEIYLIAVGTPTKENGEVDTTCIFEVVSYSTLPANRQLLIDASALFTQPTIPCMSPAVLLLFKVQ